MKNVRSFLGSALSKVLGSWTLVHNEDELEDRAEHTSLSMAMERLLKMIIPALS